MIRTGRVTAVPNKAVLLHFTSSESDRSVLRNQRLVGFFPTIILVLRNRWHSRSGVQDRRRRQLHQAIGYVNVEALRPSSDVL